MKIANCYIFIPEQKEIVNIEYYTAHPFYYWARYISNLISNNPLKPKTTDFNFLFVLEDDVVGADFYKSLSDYLQFPSNRKPLISIGVFEINDIATSLPIHYLDSSIWNFYVNILFDFSINKYPNFPEKLSNIIQIIKYYQKNLYDSIVAKEFIEFQSRLLGNSHLGLPGGHAAAVAPFVFHSEQSMKIASDGIINGINKLVKNKSDGQSKSVLEWNILRIDDYAIKKLKGGHESKESILKELLEKVIKDIKCVFHYDFATTIDKALKKIKQKNKQYDIILLDYLLGAKEDSSNQRAYGDEFLRELETNKELLKHKGPLGKFWILPISSFSNAMLSKLEEEGVGRINNNWYIMDGADMVNTPQLFRYNFLKLIELQLNTAIVTKDDIIEFVIENLVGDNGGEDNNLLRINARRLYGLYMNRFGMKEALKADAQHGSAFAKSVLDYMDKVRYEDLEFYEKVRKLLYLIGFGTHTDVHLMWDLLTYINASIKKSDFYSLSNNLAKKEIDDLMSNVATFISNLKSDG